MLFRSARGNFGFIPSFSRENVIYNTVLPDLCFFTTRFILSTRSNIVIFFLYFIRKRWTKLFNIVIQSIFSILVIYSCRDIVARRGVKKEERKKRRKNYSIENSFDSQVILFKNSSWNHFYRKTMVTTRLYPQKDINIAKCIFTPNIFGCSKRCQEANVVHAFLYFILKPFLANVF